MDKGIRPVYCMDKETTKIAEDGYLFTKEGDMHTVIVAAVSVTPDDLDIQAVLEKLGKTKDEQSRVNKKLFPQKYIFNHNLIHGHPTEAILVEFKTRSPEFLVETMNISLGVVKKFKQITYEQVMSYVMSPHYSSIKNDVRVLHKITQRNKTPCSGNISISLSAAEEFVMKMLRMYNYACSEACVLYNIPYVGKEIKNADEDELQTFGTFNCPLRNPEAAINNINLTYFLRYGLPYFTEEEVEAFLVTASKTPVN